MHWFRFVLVSYAFSLNPFLQIKIGCGSVRLGIHIKRNIATQLQLGKAIFHISAILALFEIGESQKGGRAMFLRPEQ